MSDSIEKFPVELEITRILTSSVSPEMHLYLIHGIMDANQVGTLQEYLPLTTKIALEDDRWSIATVTSHKHLCEVYALFTDLAKSWRGAYYALTNVFVDRCKEFCE